MQSHSSIIARRLDIMHMFIVHELRPRFAVIDVSRGTYFSHKPCEPVMPLSSIIMCDDCCCGNALLSRRAKVHENGFSLGIPRLSRKVHKRENKIFRNVFSAWFLRRRRFNVMWQLDTARAINSSSEYVSFYTARNESIFFSPLISYQKKENEYIILARNIWWIRAYSKWRYFKLIRLVLFGFSPRNFDLCKCSTYERLDVLPCYDAINFEYLPENSHATMSNFVAVKLSPKFPKFSASSIEDTRDKATSKD